MKSRHRDVPHPPAMKTFTNNANAVVVGATGGIGRALTARLTADSTIGNVYALSRTSFEPQSDKQVAISADTADEASIEAAAESVAEPIDLVIVATGILHRGDSVTPEKTIRELQPASMLEVMMTNALGPALVAKHFLPKLRRGGKTVFAAVSARVGSISDNRLGGWTSYRASKSALNMILKTFSIEHARRWPDSVVAALHPGTVDTRLSAPFQRNVPDGKLFSPDQSAGYLLDVIDGLDSPDTGGFFAWDGSRIEF